MTFYPPAFDRSEHASLGFSLRVPDPFANGSGSASPAGCSLVYDGFAPSRGFTLLKPHPETVQVPYVYQEREREMFYLTTHSTHFIYGYMASDIWLRTILIVRKETRCRHIGYSYRLTARVLLYAPSHRQD